MPVASSARARPRFAPPRTRPGVLRRPRLLDRLSSALDAGATLLVAPAGYGKTTLVAAWLREIEADAAWLSLNPAHRDPSALANDLVGALARLVPAIEALRARAAAGDGPQTAEALLHALASALDEADDFSLLVLDDIDELIGAEAALALLDRLIAHPLPAVHPLLLARQTPALPSRLRKVASGEVDLLDATDLAFTDAEAGALLEQAGVLEAAARDTVIERAHGWPLALTHLAVRALAAPRSEGAASSLLLEDFIQAEVIAPLSTEDRALIEACVVPSFFDGEIAAELTLRPDAGSALRALQGRTQLIEAVGEGHWLRLHGLLREHCLSILARDEPARLATLRERAARALARRGELDEATALALDAEAWPLARSLILEQAESLNGRGAWGTLAAWLARLPSEELAVAPALALLQVRVAIRMAHLQAAHELLDRLDIAGLSLTEQAQAFLYRAVTFRQARRLDDARREHRRARTIIQEHEPAGSLLRVEADLEEGITLGMAGDVAASAQLLGRAASGAEAIGNIRLAAEATQNLGHALQLSGRLGAAQEALREATRRWQHLGEREFRLLALNNGATITHSLGDLTSATAAFEEVTAQAERIGVPRLQALGALGLADIARDRGDLERADALYEHALEIARAIDHAGIVAASSFGRAMSLRECGALIEARSLLEHHLRVTEEQGANEFAARFHIGLAGVLLSEGRLPEAKAALAAVLEEPGGGYQRRQLALLMRATVEYRLGAPQEAERTLLDLQALIEGLGYDQFLVAEARLCPDLLSDPRVAALPGGYYPQLLARAGAVAASASPSRLEEPHFVVRAFGLPTITRPHDAAANLVWRTERSKELFLFLLCSSGPVSREELTVALWPEVPAAGVPGFFHSVLYRLRRTLGVPVVIHEHGKYYLDPALRVDFDVRAFEEHLARAEGAADPLERTRELETAIALYGGAFAPSYSSGWAEATRARLTDRYLGARLALAAHELSAERYPRAIAHAQAALDADPLSEEAVRHLIAAHVGRGHPDLALRVYRRLQDLSEREGGGPPSEDTRRALERALLGARPSA